MPILQTVQEIENDTSTVYRLPNLLGGLNTSTHPLDIAPNQAVEARNVSFYRGQLAPDFGIGVIPEGKLYDTLPGQTVEQNGAGEGRALDLWSFLLRDGEKLNILFTAAVDAQTTGSNTGKYGTRFRSVEQGTAQHRHFDSALPDTALGYCVYVIWSNAIIHGISGQGAPDAHNAKEWATSTNLPTRVSLGNLIGTDEQVNTEETHVATSFSAEGCVVWQGFIFFWNIDEGNSRHPQRIRWSDRGNIEEWTGGLSGYVDLFDSTDDIIALVPLNEYLICYRRSSVIRIEYKGIVDDLFSFQTVVQVDGPSRQRQIAAARGRHFFVGDNGIYQYTGGLEVQEVSVGLRHIFDTKRNKELIHTSELTYLESLERLTWYFDAKPALVGDYRMFIWQLNRFGDVPVWTGRTLDDHPEDRLTPTKFIMREYWHQNVYTYTDWINTAGLVYNPSNFLPTYEYYLESNSPQRIVAVLNNTSDHENDLWGYGPEAGYLEQRSWAWSSAGFYMGQGEGWEVTGFTVNLPRRYAIHGDITMGLYAVRDAVDTEGRADNPRFRAGRSFPVFNCLPGGTISLTDVGIDNYDTPTPEKCFVRNTGYVPFIIRLEGTPDANGSYRHHNVMGMSIHMSPQKVRERGRR